MIDTGLQDKVVLITGANNPLGIGAETARAFAREGARIFLTYLRLSPEALISIEPSKQRHQVCLITMHCAQKRQMKLFTQSEQSVAVLKPMKLT